MSVNDPGAEAGSGAPDARRLEIRVLGPVEVAWDGQLVDIGGVKTRALMARLLVDRGVVVSADALADSLWGEDEGNAGQIALRSTISRLRKRIRAAGGPDDLIVTRAPGYALVVPAEVTDAYRFKQLVAAGRQALRERSADEAARLLVEAEGLWRGPAYREVCDEPFARAEARRLDELRLSAIETRIDAELTLGRHAALVGELESLTSAHPLRERLWSQRMLALYRSGRQAEALRVFQELRNILVTELGIEPGHDVTWMEHAILSHEPALDFSVPAEGGAVGRTAPEDVAPLPAADRFRGLALQFDTPFVGRGSESAQLRQWWASLQTDLWRLLLVDGDPGIGKTRLVAELVRSLEAEGVLVLWGRCDEDPVAPFHPFAHALGRYYESQSADRISRMPTWQLTELSRLVVRLREYAPPFEEETGDPQAERYRFFEAVAATLKELSSRRRVLMVIDELHWIDQPTLLLLRHVLRDVAGPDFGFVGMYVDTEVDEGHLLRPALADARSLHRVVEVHLRGLGAAAVEELTKIWASALTELVPQLRELTDGNPLFLQELLRQFREDGEGFEAPGDPTVGLDLTPTEAIRELVARRVSRLPEDVIYLLQAAAVAGRRFEASVVAEAADLTAGQMLDAFDRAEESRLLRPVEAGVGDHYAFTHVLVRDAIYEELLRGRRVRYHHKIALATERAHADELDHYVNELALHFYEGAAMGDADKALRYCMAAGERAARSLAFEEAVLHFSRGLNVVERFGPSDPGTRCDVLLELGEVESRAGDRRGADEHLAQVADLARQMGDAERLAAAALGAGPPSYFGLVGPSEEQVELLREAVRLLPEQDSHLRAMVTTRLGLVLAPAPGERAEDRLGECLELSARAVAMARRLGDRHALGYALSGRLHVLWGPAVARERLATSIELGEIAADIGDDRLGLEAHLWRVRELLAVGDVGAVSQELADYAAHDGPPVDALEASFACNAEARMAFLAGDVEAAERLARQALRVPEGFEGLARSLTMSVMWWIWWQKGELALPDHEFRDTIAQSAAPFTNRWAAWALIHAEAQETDDAVGWLRKLLDIGWPDVGGYLTEGLPLAWAAAACSAVGAAAHEPAAHVYESLRPFAGTAVVTRAPAMGCAGPADQYLGLLARLSGDQALAEVHFEASLRLARRMGAAPFVAAAELELARTLRRRRPEEEADRIARLLRHAEESALAMGLRRLAQLAAEPG